MKVALLADIQINCSSKTYERIRDTKRVLDSTAKSLQERMPDYIVLAGDIFEHYETTDDERLIYTSFINQLLKIPAVHIIVIDGNHDIRHKNFSIFDGIQNAAKTNVLMSLNDAIDNSQYHYSPYATVYEFQDAVFGCWSELARYCQEYGKMSPWSGQTYEGKAVFDVYHGTVAGAKDMGSGYQPEPDNVSFQAPVALLGHIHMHQVLKVNDTWCVYPSSLLIRNFAEGARYDANGEVYNYCSSHGYCMIEGSNIEFIPIVQPTKYVTLVVDATWTKEHFDQVTFAYTSSNVKFKVITDCPNADVLAYIYNAISNRKNWHLQKAEPVAAKFIATEGIAVTDKLQMNIETFENIANELLQPRNLTDDVHAKTIELLRQECGYHLTVDAPKNIKLVSASISNFKTIDKAVLDLSSRGLTLLSANNGAGKTTIMEAICFALTGMHNASFKKNAKNHQLIRLFNDKQPQNDKISIEVRLSINNTCFEVHVAIDKVMKQGWTVDNWQTMVATVRKYVAVYEDKGEEDELMLIAEGDEAEKWLVQNFGDFRDFSTLHSINSMSLQAIKEMDDDALANFMLQRLGYSVLQRLQFYVGGCKAGAIEKTPKTTNDSVVELNKKLLDAEAMSKDMQQKSSEYEATIQSKQQELHAVQSTLDDLRSKLYPIDETKVNEYLAILQPYESLIAKGADLQSYLPALTKAIEDANAASHTKAVLANKHTDALLRYNAEQQIVNEAYNKAKDELTWTIQDNIRVTKDKIYRLQLDMQNAQSQISTAETEAKRLSALITQEHAVDAKLRQELNSINDNRCPTCGQIMNADEAQGLRTAKLKQIEEHDATVAKLRDDLGTVNLRIENLGTDYKRAKEKYDKESEELKRYEAELAAITDNAIKAKVDYTKLDNIKKEIEAITAEINAVQVQDLTTLLAKRDKLQAAINAKAQYDALQSHITANNAIRTSIDAEQTKQRTLQTEHDAAANAKVQVNAMYDVANADIEKYKRLIEERKAYDITIAAVAQYDWLVNEGLPKYLYSHAVAVVNNYIDSLGMPASICPRLSVEQYGRLTLIDRRNDGQLITRPIQEASGMELALSGLVLCFALHNAKLTVDFPFIMIDEVSGVLNEGNTHDTTNYMQLFTNILNIAAKDMQLLVVDHRINPDDCDVVYEVVKQPETNTTILKRL